MYVPHNARGSPRPVVVATVHRRATPERERAHADNKECASRAFVPRLAAGRWPRVPPRRAQEALFRPRLAGSIPASLARAVSRARARRSSHRCRPLQPSPRRRPRGSSWPPRCSPARQPPAPRPPPRRRRRPQVRRQCRRVSPPAASPPRRPPLGWPRLPPKGEHASRPCELGSGWGVAGERLGSVQRTRRDLAEATQLLDVVCAGPRRRLRFRRRGGRRLGSCSFGGSGGGGGGVRGARLRPLRLASRLAVAKLGGVRAGGGLAPRAKGRAELGDLQRRAARRHLFDAALPEARAHGRAGRGRAEGGGCGVGALLGLRARRWCGLEDLGLEKLRAHRLVRVAVELVVSPHKGRHLRRWG